MPRLLATTRLRAGIRLIPARRQNLIPWSEDVTNTGWNDSNLATIVGGQPGPFPGLSSQLLLDNSGSGIHQFFPSVGNLGAIQTSSFYCAPVTAGNWFNFGINNGALSVFCNPNNGAFGTVPAGLTVKSIGPFANGFYQFVLTYFGNAAGTQERIQIAQGGNNSSVSFTGTGVNGFYVAGFQRVTANWAGPYTKTTSTPVYTGNIRNIAPLFQNLLPDSNGNSQSSFWSLSGISSFIPNTTDTLDPFGGNNAFAVVESNNNGNHWIRNVGGASRPGTPYTVSIFAKAGTESWLYFSPEGSGAFAASFNLSTGTIGTLVGIVSAKMIPYGNAWYKCIVTYIADVTNTTNQYFYSSGANNSPSYQGTTNNKPTYYYGAQLVNANWAGPLQLNGVATLLLNNIRNIVI